MNLFFFPISALAVGSGSQFGKFFPFFIIKVGLTLYIHHPLMCYKCATFRPAYLHATEQRKETPLVVSRF